LLVFLDWLTALPLSQHWGPAPKDAGNDGADEKDDEMDVDETDYLPVAAAAAAGPVRRKEKKGMDFSRWWEFAGGAPPKRTQGKPAQVKIQSLQKVDAGAMNSKVGVSVASKKELAGGGMLLDSADSMVVTSSAALVTDVAPKKQIAQVESRGETKPVVVRDVVSEGDGMELDGQQSSMEAEINAENMARLAEMTAGEIAEAQEEILNRMDPKLVEMLRRRAREKSGEKKGGDRDKVQKNSGPGKAAKATPGGWLTAGEHSGHSWKAWSDRVERIRSCRFSLEGAILGFLSHQEQQDGT
jgi:RNA polymerase II-associated protein 1